jgi:hypothetical protein
MDVARHSCLTNCSQILSPSEENTNGVYLFILNMTCYKWGIHELFIVVRSLQVGWEFIKRLTYEKLHLWSN